MRLSSPDVTATHDTITITYNGKSFTALPDETLAASLIAAGYLQQRTTAKGNPRGVFCGMGVCFDCLLTVDGKPSQRACMTKVQPGMVVSSLPDGLVYPQAAGPPLAAPPAAEIPEQDCELLIVGAGPGGLAAAVAAAESGAQVLIIDERPQAGGQYFKQLAESHHPLQQQDKQFRQGQALIKKTKQANIELLNATTVWGGFVDEQGMLEIGILQNDHDRARILKPKQLIVATGAYEQPLPVPGWTLPGVMTTGAAQTLARSYRVSPGKRVLVAGNGPLNLQVACELLHGGADVVAVVESSPSPWQRWLKALHTARSAPNLILQGWRYLKQLRHHQVSIFYQHALTQVEGKQQAEGAIIARIDEQGTPITAQHRQFQVDVVCMNYGFLPSNELLRLLGCKQYPTTTPGYLMTECDDQGRTSIDKIFVVGEAGRINGAQVALLQGRLAGWSAAKALGYAIPSQSSAKFKKAQRQLHRQKRFQQRLWSLFSSPALDFQFAKEDTLLCRCEEVSFAQINQLLDQGITRLGTLKRLTRAGMGRCQGRYCTGFLLQLLDKRLQQHAQADNYFAPQLPIKPIPAIALACEKPEWGGHKREILNACQQSQKPNKDILKTDVVVIGGGIVGCASAYFLARAGCEVMLLERDEANTQASGSNAGSLHVQLLSFDFGTKAEAGGRPATITLPLQLASVALWQELEQTLKQDFELKISGGLMVAETKQDLEFLHAKIAIERAQGLEVELIDAMQLRDLAPAISEHMIGAAYCPQEGKINPLLATTGILQGALALGIDFRPNTNVTGIQLPRTGFSITTNNAEIRCRRIVNAAGPWTPHIAKMVGISLPVHGAPLQMIVTEAATPMLDQLVAHSDRHLTMKQTRQGQLIIGGGWTASTDPKTGYSRILRKSVEGNLWVANRVVPALRQLHVLRTWAAMNINIDGAPIIGELPTVPGFYNAVTSNGYTLGPLIGQLIADLIVRNKTDWDLAPFSVSRF